MPQTRPNSRRQHYWTAASASLAIAVSALMLPASSSAAPEAARAAAEDRWSGRWDAEGDSNEDGVYEHFGVLTLELVTDGSLDGLNDGICEETDLKYSGSYKYGGGGIFEACEIAHLDSELFGNYYGNDGLWGQANMAFTGGSPPSWEGYFSPPTENPHGEQAYLQWRATKLADTPGCAAPQQRAPSGSRGTTQQPEESCLDPVIFIPGFLGTEIGCPKSDFFDELWPNSPSPEFANMRLNSNGTGNLQEGANKCNQNAEPGPVVYKAFTEDIYAGFRKWLNGLEGVDTYFFGYDWRKSPGDPGTQKALDRLIVRALLKSGREKVTLVTHSMGGLVARWYVGSKGSRYVGRVVTMAAPYWGAPKPWLALTHGWTGPPDGDWWPDLDSFIPDPQLKKFAVNAAGAYFLYPSPAYYQANGGWLFVGSEGPFTQEATVQAVKLFQGNELLYERALAAHTQRLDAYAGTAGLDWQMIVGTGLPTVTIIAEQGTNPDESPTYTYGNGDGTVPVNSAAQGVTDEDIVHYVCGVEHAGMPNNEEVQEMIKDFVRFGGAIPTRHPGGCPAPSQ